MPFLTSEGHTHQTPDDLDSATIYPLPPGAEPRFFALPHLTSQCQAWEPGTRPHTSPGTAPGGLLAPPRLGRFSSYSDNTWYFWVAVGGWYRLVSLECGKPASPILKAGVSRDLERRDQLRLCYLMAAYEVGGYLGFQSSCSASLRGQWSRCWYRGKVGRCLRPSVHVSLISLIMGQKGARFGQL